MSSKLFNRKTNGTELTGVGARFLVHAERIESAMLAADELAGTDGLIGGTVRVGARENKRMQTVPALRARMSAN